MSIIRYAENLLASMLNKFVSSHQKESSDDYYSVKTQPVYPEEVCYRVLIYVFHKYSMASKISNVSSILSYDI